MLYKDVERHDGTVWILLIFVSNIAWAYRINVSEIVESTFFILLILFAYKSNMCSLDDISHKNVHIKGNYR